MTTTPSRLGIMDDATYEKVTVRHLGDKAPPTGTQS